MTEIKMPRMLQRLSACLDDIERESDWEYRFVCDLVERFEDGVIDRLSDKQFAKLHQISQKY